MSLRLLKSCVTTAAHSVTATVGRYSSAAVTRATASYNDPMRKATDTTLRNLAVLATIPAYPNSKSTTQIQNELRDKNPDYDVTARTVQRSLEQLSAVFPITADTRGRANHWYWIDKHALMQIPSMSASTAFALRLAAEHLKPIMPGSALRQLDPYFRHAAGILDGTALGRWIEKVAIIGRGPVLKPPNISDEVRDAVHTALMENRQLEVDYRSRARMRSQRIVVNPLGLVVREAVVYLAATAWGYKDIRHYVLHRMRSPELLDAPAIRPPGFRLSQHIQEDLRFSYPVNPGKIRLRALFAAGAAIHLAESRLAADQRITETDDGCALIEATVPDTADLRWWLLGFGSAVEVLEPAALREEFRRQSEAMREIYA